MAFKRNVMFDSLYQGKELTKEQEDIFTFIQKGIGNAVINAVAGSGKSSTIRGCLTLIPENEKKLVITHNKSVAEEMKKSLQEAGYSLKNTEITTFHSMGFKIIKANGLLDIQNVKVASQDSKEEKYNRQITENILSYTEEDIHMDSVKLTVYKSNVMELLALSQANLVQTTEEINSIAEKYGIEPISNEIETVEKLMGWGRSMVSDELSYGDMLWLPNELNLKIPFSYRYSYIFVDEAQDMSPAQMGIVKKLINRGTRVVAVGDTYQSINMWCGAKVNALDELKKMPSTLWTDLSLSVNYRCGKRIIDFANAKNAKNGLPFTITPFSNAPKGEIVYDVPFSEIKDGNMVLCRTSAPLISLYIRLRLSGKPAKFITDGFQEMFIGLLKSIDGNTVEDIRRKLSEESESVSYIQNIMDILAGLNKDMTKEELIKCFENEGDNPIILSTIHKAKGLENDIVYILPSPVQYGLSGWQLESEKNLEYVALTRAKHILGFLKI